MLHSLKYAITCSEGGPTVTWVSLCYENIDMDKTNYSLPLFHHLQYKKAFSTPSSDENVQPEYIILIV